MDIRGRLITLVLLLSIHGLTITVAWGGTYIAKFENDVGDGQKISIKALEYKISTWESVSFGGKFQVRDGEEKAQGVSNYFNDADVRHWWRFEWRCAGVGDNWHTYQHKNSGNNGVGDSNARTTFTFITCYSRDITTRIHRWQPRRGD